LYADIIKEMIIDTESITVSKILEGVIPLEIEFTHIHQYNGGMTELLSHE